MSEDFIYERRRLPNGVKIETVTGGDRYKGRVWTEIAKQIYCENGKEGYRELGHFQSGAPFLYDSDEKISISHTEGCLVVATISVSPETNLGIFTPEAALGIDVEKADRQKAVALRERFLSPEELLIVPADSLEANVTAWTCKEAMLKAGMNPAIAWHSDIVITRLPQPSGMEGSGFIILGGERHEMSLLSVKYDGYIITTAR